LTVEVENATNIPNTPAARLNSRIVVIPASCRVSPAHCISDLSSNERSTVLLNQFLSESALMSTSTQMTGRLWDY